MFLYILLRAKHHVLDLLEVSVVLIKLSFEGHSCVNLLLEEVSGFINLHFDIINLLRIVALDRVKLLLLDKNRKLIFRIYSSGYDAKKRENQQI